MLLLLATTGVGCGKPWRVVHQAAQNPLGGNDRVAVARLSFAPDAIETPLDDPPRALGAIERGFNTGIVEPHGIAVTPAQPGTAPPVVVPTVSEIRSSGWETRVTLAARIDGGSDGDQVVLSSTLQARVQPDHLRRLEQVGETLGRNLARYLNERRG